MASSPSTRIALRATILLLLLVGAFYVGRPLYWKISATIHEIREKRQTVRQGISQIVLDAQKSVGWVHDEFDSGSTDDRGGAKVATRRILRR